MKKTILLLAVCLIVVCNVSSQNKFQHQNPHFNPGHDYTGYSHIQNESPGPFHIAQSDQILSPVEEYGDPPDWSWASQFGGSGADVARDLVSSEDGNVYICGSFSGEIVVDGETFNCIGKKDSYVAKFSNTGTFLWLKHIPAAEDEYIEAFGINLDALSNVHVTGYFTGNATVGTHNLLGIGDRNLFYVKLNPDSDILFANDHEGSAYSEVGQVIDTDGAGNAYILGSWEGNLSYRDKSFLLKYDQFGNESFVEYYMQNFNDIEVVGTSIYFAGRVLEPESIGEFVIAIDFVDDVFLLKSDLDLNYQWIKLATQTSTFYSPSVCYGLFVNQMEELFITGNMRNNLTFDNIGLEGYGGFVFKFDANGDAIWGSLIDEFVYGVYYPDDIDGFAGQIQVLIDEYVFSLDAVSGDIILNAKAPSGAVELGVDVSGNINMCGQLNQLIFASQYNTGLSQNWMVNFEGNSSSVRVFDICTDQYGEFYLLGSCLNPIEYFGQTIGGGVFLSKQDQNGNVLWLKDFTGFFDIADYGVYMAIDTIAGMLYFTGNLVDDFVFPEGNTYTAGDEGSILIARYDLSGSLQWVVQENIGSNSLSTSVDISGNVLVFGEFGGTIQIGNTQLTSAGGQDLFVAKYDHTGAFLWAERFGGSDGSDYWGMVSCDHQQNVYITAELTSTDVTIGSYSFPMNEGDGNILLAKLGPGGNILWVRSTAGSTIPYNDWSCWPTGMEVSPEGYIYIKGWHGDSTWFDGIMLRSTHGYGYSYFLAKFNTNGNVMWANSITEYLYGFDYNQFSLDKDGNAYLGAQARDTLEFGEDFTYVPQGASDLFVAKYMSDGELSWVKITGSSSNEYAHISGVSVVDEYKIFTAGDFREQLNFGNTILQANNQHGFVAYMDGETGIKVYDATFASLPFNMLPNPSDGRFTLVFEEPVRHGKIQITDVTGKVLSYSNFEGLPGSVQFDLSFLQAGVYFVSVESGDRREVRKLVIE